MMKAALLTFFCLLVVQTYSQSAFRANVYVRETNMINGGYVEAELTYDYNTATSYLLKFTKQGYSELYDYNPTRGTGAAPPYRDQYRFETGSGCNCQTSPLDHPMPAFDYQATVNGQKLYERAGDRTIVAFGDLPGRVCQYWQPRSAPCCGGSNYKSTTNIVFITVDGDGNLCSARFKDGREIFVKPSSLTIVTPPASAFSPPSDCKCDKPIDILIVLDRSASIQRSQFEDEKIFITNFVHQFTISSSAAAVNLIHFNTKAWTTTVGGLNAGQSLVNVNNMLADLECCTGPGVGSLCCEGWTSISAGVREAGNQLADSNRKSTATQIVLVLTDGFHNSKSTNPKVDGAFCYDPCDHEDEGSALWVACIKGQTSYTSSNLLSSCSSDLNAGMNYLISKAPNVITYAVSVVAPQTSAEGKQVANDQALIIARGDPSRIITVSSFSELATKSIELVARACAANAAPCGSSCCGYCVCKVCKSPDACDDGKFCTLESVPAGKTCCETTTRPCADSGTDKCKKDICYEERCIPDDTAAAKSCVAGSNQCYGKACVPADGSCKTTDYIAIENQKLIDNNDKCREAYCTSTGKIAFRDKSNVCPPTASRDPCFTYTCVPTTGLCDVKQKTIPTSINTSDKCKKWYCDGTYTGTNAPWTYNTTGCPTDDKCVNPKCDPATGSCLYPPKSCRKSTDKCDFGYCDPTNGNCVVNRTVCPPFENGDQCRPLAKIGVGNDGCDPNSGTCQYTSKNCPRLDCKDRVCVPADGSCIDKDTPGCEGGLCAGNTCSNLNACLRQMCDETSPIAMNCLLERPIVDCPLEQLNNKNTCRVLDETIKSSECTKTPPGPTCGCDDTQGCVFKDIDCTAVTPTDGCHYVVADPTAPGCCVEREITCEGGSDPCNTYACNPSTGTCEATPNCDLSGNNACATTTCNPITGACETTTVDPNSECIPPPCTTLDPTSVCDPTGETCKFLPIPCDSDDLCQVGHCDVATNACVYEPIVCDDGSPCTRDACVAGECVFTDISSECDDNNACTIDRCDPLNPEGCVSEYINVTEECEDYDLCTIDRCDPAVGCVNVPVNCSDGNPCTEDLCDPFIGCLARAIECNTSVPCTVAFCNPDRLNCGDGSVKNDDPACNPDNEGDASKYQPPQNNNTNPLCDVRGLGCYIGTLKSPAVIGGVLGAAAIIGIVLGVVACLALTGGGAWAAYSNMADAGVANTMVNPTYVGAQNAGSNPLFMS